MGARILPIGNVVTFADVIGRKDRIGRTVHAFPE